MQSSSMNAQCNKLSMSVVRNLCRFIILVTAFLINIPLVNSFATFTYHAQNLPVSISKIRSRWCITVPELMRQRRQASLLNMSGDDPSIEDLWLLEDCDDDDDDEDDLFGIIQTSLNAPSVSYVPPSSELVDNTGEKEDDDISGKDSIDIESHHDEDKREGTIEERSVKTPTKTKNVKDNSVSSPSTVKKEAPIIVKKKVPIMKDKITINSNGTRTVGVGRHGYNLTVLSQVHYQVEKYFPLNDQITYQIRLDLLRDYFNEHGDVNVPFRYVGETYDYGVDKKRKEEYKIALGRWLHNLRKKYQADKNKIPKEVRQSLDSMGMQWMGVGAGSRPSTFRKRCKELRSFVDENGHDRVSLEGKQRSLGLWVERQRVLYRKLLEGGDCGDQLTDERVDMLKKAGFDLDSLVNKSSNGKHNPRQHIFDQQWMDMYGRLKGFKDDHGHVDVEIGWGESDFSSLLSWAAEQKHQLELLRNAFLSGARNLKSILTPVRYQTLVGLGFNFTMDSATSLPWEDVANYNFDAALLMNLLSQHCEATGRCDLMLADVYTNEDIENTLQLYKFQQRLRWEHKHCNLRKQTIVSHKWILEEENLGLVEQLNSLGFSWDNDMLPNAATSTLQREYEWWEGYHDFLRYREANGDLDPEIDGIWYSEDLADWVEEQKIEFSKVLNKGTECEGETESQTISMTEWHFHALKAIGFDSEAYHRSTVLHSVGRKPSVLSLEKDLENEVKNLPEDLKKSSGGGKRIEKAEQLAWLIRYASLRRYYSKGGSGALSNVSSDDKSGQILAFWANNQRKQYTNFMTGIKSTLTKERIRLLEDIGFDWKLTSPGGEEEWEEMKEELIQFEERFGHCFVPASFPLNARLGQWVLLQRQLYQHSRKSDQEGLILPSVLTKKKEKQLLSIGLDLTMDNLAFGNMAYETIWKCRLDELAAFKQLEGHCSVPMDYTSPYYDLGLWVREQRILFLRNNEGIASQLDKRRIDDLLQLGFLFDPAVEGKECEKKDD